MKKRKSLLGKIKQALRDYQSDKELERRRRHVEEQHRLIYEGLEDRGD